MLYNYLLIHTNLDSLSINSSFSLRIKLNNNSKLVKDEINLFEEAKFRTNIKNNKLNTFISFNFLLMIKERIMNIQIGNA